MTWQDVLSRVTGAKDAAIKATEQVQTQLTAAREAIAAKRGELQRQGELLPPAAELIAHAERLVDETAAAYGRNHAHTFLASLAGRLTPLSGRETTVVPRPQLPFEPSDPLPFTATCFLFQRETKAALRAAVLAHNYEAGVPSAARGPLLERLGRELAELESIEEGLVDAMAASGIVTSHRPAVVERRAREARARELAARKAEDQRFLEEQRQGGRLGTPRVHTARLGGVPIQPERRS
jgi:hypothetical protein